MGGGLTTLATTDESAPPLEVEDLEAGRETALYSITWVDPLVAILACPGPLYPFSWFTL